MIGIIKDRKEYCDFLANELADVKKRINDIADRGNDLPSEDREGMSEMVSSHLRELNDLIDSKLRIISKNCLEWEQGREQRAQEGRSEKVQPEGVPYSNTPI